MRVLDGADTVLLNLGRHQQNLKTLTGALASGLRIQGAADDPSGLAISENLRSRVSGLQQSVENVQTGGNLLTVADGAAETIQKVLQRINSLIIESNSDINSNDQLQAIQTEIGQLLLEINRVAQNANFNGLKLFDGSHDTFVSAPNAPMVVTEINPGIAPNGNVATDTVANSGLPSSKLIDPTTVLEASGQQFTGLFIFKLSNFDPGTNSLTIEQDMFSTDPSFATNGTESIQVQSGIPTGTGPNLGGGAATPINISVPSGLGLTVNLANLSPSDAGGVAEGFVILAPRSSGGGTAININDGGQEGSVVSISLPSLSTNALQISDISVLRPNQVDFANNPSGVDSSNQFAAMDAQFRVQTALESISSLLATLGAQMVSTQQDANNDNIAIVNLQASESSIRDLSIGTATTEVTREQILNNVGTSVLSQMEVSASQLTGILISALAGR